MTVTFDRPLDAGAVIHIHGELFQDLLLNGEIYGGSSATITGFAATFEPGPTTISFAWSYRRPYLTGGLTTIGTYSGYGFQDMKMIVEYEGTTPIGYTATLAQVPEPASWAMVIVGFGAVGASMRRRRLPSGQQIEASIRSV